MASNQQGIITQVSSAASDTGGGGRGARLRELRNRAKQQQQQQEGEETSGEGKESVVIEDNSKGEEKTLGTGTDDEDATTGTGTAAHGQTATGTTGTIGTTGTTTTTVSGGGERDKEKASLNTPVTVSGMDEKDKESKVDAEDPGGASIKPASLTDASNKDKNNEKAKQKANGTQEKATGSSSQANTKKSGFWSSLLRALVPCIGPSKAHDLDIDEVQRPSSQRTPSAQKSPPPANTSAAATESEKEKEKPKQSPPKPADIDTSLPLTQIPTAPPTPSQTVAAGGEVIVPPTPPSHLLPEGETHGLMSGSVQPPGGEAVLHDESRADGAEGEGEEEYTDGEGDTTRDSGGTGGIGMTEEEEEERLIMQGGAGIPLGPNGEPRPLLPPLAKAHEGRKCLVLDLDETLVHSSFKLIPQADYVVPVEIEHQFHNVYVIKRPGVDAFLQKMGELYEVVVFTASLSKYADPVLDKLDTLRVVTHRLFRESCYNHKGNYVKDLSQLGRPINSTIILDNSPASYLFHPNNAVPVSSWFNDPHDTELMDLCPFLGDLRVVDDVRGVLDGGL